MEYLEEMLFQSFLAGNLGEKMTKIDFTLYLECSVVLASQNILTFSPFYFTIYIHEVNSCITDIWELLLQVLLLLIVVVDWVVV